MPTQLPFTFAWVDQGQNSFDPNTMNVFDETILSLEVKHEEGQIPTLDMVIQNPRIGFLNPSRKVWGWLAWQSPASHPVYAGALVPLFFGVLVGIPTSLFQEKITIKMIARSPTFIADKQAAAEAMKTVPYYDPVWIETNKRDDPDTILEGWSALWHIDRLTLAVTHSDILSGEDGTATFHESDALYNSVSLQLGQPPLTNIRVEATVNWTQRSAGYIDVPPVNMSSYTGDSLMGDWPKPGGSIGGGYKCEASFVIDTYRISQTPTTSYSSQWNNTMPNLGQCSNQSASTSSSGPALIAPDPLINVLVQYYQSGICDPFSDPPINRPMTASSSGVIIPLWNVSMSMTMRYDARREFSEVLAFDMTANTQSILTSPLIAQNTELLALSSVDVSEPLIEIEAWTDFAGQEVGLAQMIFPNNPTKPGGLATQICVTAGTAGANEPVFSDIVGDTTTDGSVVWASMGTSPLTTAASWSPGSYVPLGQMMLLHDQVFKPSLGVYEDIPGGTSYYICTTAGVSNGVYDTFAYQPPVTSNVEAPPALRHISTINQPAFSTTVGHHIADGSVTWTVLGATPTSLGIPIGGTPDNVTARSFFPTARGIQSVEYLISKARARLRFRARAVKIGWECRFEDAVALSCRKNATLFDPRFPGGAATGKVTSYSLIAGGDGRIIGKVEIGCSVGLGDSINEITGSPVYAKEGYMQKGYQRYEGAMVSHGSFDTTFSLPVFKGFDDGLKFPLRWEDISDGGLVSGSIADQKAAITKSFQTALQLQYLQNWGGSISSSTNPSTTTTGVPPDVAWHLEREMLALTTANTPYVMAANPVSWSCLLKPCSGNGPFGGAYSIEVSPLVLPQGINLEAPSSP